MAYRITPVRETVTDASPSLLLLQAVLSRYADATGKVSPGVGQRVAALLGCSLSTVTRARSGKRMTMALTHAQRAALLGHLEGKVELPGTSAYQPPNGGVRGRPRKADGRTATCSLTNEEEAALRARGEEDPRGIVGAVARALDRYLLDPGPPSSPPVAGKYRSWKVGREILERLDAALGPERAARRTAHIRAAILQFISREN